jgi:hypothetical protein
MKSKQNGWEVSGTLRRSGIGTLVGYGSRWRSECGQEEGDETKPRYY